MQDIKNKLINLRNSMDEDSFDLNELKEAIQKIDANFYSNFASILEVDEAACSTDLGDKTIKFVYAIVNSAYVDIEKLEELDYYGIMDRLNKLIDTL